MRKLKIGVVGAQGRMGSELLKLISASRRLEATVAVVKEGECLGYKRTINNLGLLARNEVDVLIDFSSPDSTKKVVQTACALGVPLVSGVTGISASDLKLMKGSARKTAILWAPNMSFGVALLRASLSLLATLKGFDFQIIETHHKKKKDKPSGTALLLQETLEKHLGEQLPGVLSIRGGGVIGDHKVIAISDEEQLEFSHRALSRAVFARGALIAAEWLSKHQNGFFELEDMIRNG